MALRMPKILYKSPCTTRLNHLPFKRLKMKTLIAILLDESGSMGVRRDDTIGGYNTFIEDQRELKEQDTRLYLIKFNTRVRVVEEGIPIDLATKLSNETYKPNGGTALYDAVREGICLVEKDKTSQHRVVFVIMTDGEENSSRSTSKEWVRDMIQSRERQGDWTFVYIGEDPSGWKREISSRSNAMSFDVTDDGGNFSYASEACTKVPSSQLSSLDKIFE